MHDRSHNIYVGKYSNWTPADRTDIKWRSQSWTKCNSVDDVLWDYSVNNYSLCHYNVLSVALGTHLTVTHRQTIAPSEMSAIISTNSLQPDLPVYEGWLCPPLRQQPPSSCPGILVFVGWYPSWNWCIAMSHNHSQPSLSLVNILLHLRHLTRMDENADASQVIYEPPPESWRRPPGWPRTNLTVYLCFVI